MTKLTAIDGHNLYLWCHCGHRGQMAVDDLLQTLPDATTVDQVTKAARCKGCGRKGTNKDVRIVFASSV